MEESRPESQFTLFQAFTGRVWPPSFVRDRGKKGRPPRKGPVSRTGGVRKRDTTEETWTFRTKSFGQPSSLPPMYFRHLSLYPAQSGTYDLWVTSRNGTKIRVLFPRLQRFVLSPTLQCMTLVGCTRLTSFLDTVETVPLLESSPTVLWGDLSHQSMITGTSEPV